MRKLLGLFVVLLFVILPYCGKETAKPAAEIPKALSCPYPGSLPFSTEAHSFNHPDNVKQAKKEKIISYSTFDYYANSPTYPQVLTGVVGYGNGLSINVPLKDEYVSLWYFNSSEWIQLGRTKTDGNGFYLIKIPDDKKLGYGAHVLYLIVEGDHTCEEQLTFIYPPKSQFVVSDIDGTLTTDDGQIIQQILDPDYVPKMWDDAVDVMDEYVKKGYYIVYLTARAYPLRTLTREWLDQEKFPLGLLITAYSFVSGDSAAAFKTAVLRHMIDDLKWQIVAAHGNADSDIEAYQAVGIPNNRIFIIGENGGHKGSTAVSSYSDFLKDIMPTIPDAQQPSLQ